MRNLYESQISIFDLNSNWDPTAILDHLGWSAAAVTDARVSVGAQVASVSSSVHRPVYILVNSTDWVRSSSGYMASGHRWCLTVTV